MSEQPSPAPEQETTPAVIQIDDFLKLDLRVARVVEAIEHPNADKLFVLKVDMGTETRQICAGLRGHYEASDLVGKQLVVVANLAPRKMRGEVSQGMLLAASGEDKGSVIVISPESDIEAGARVG